MKIQVIVDRDGNIVGALAKGRGTSDAKVCDIRPVHPDHHLHELEVSDDAIHHAPREFEMHLKSLLGHKPSA